MSQLVGRDQQTRRLQELLGGATKARSGSLLLLGEAGTGKSALLAEARDAACELGATVLSCRGLEPDSQLSYAGLADLLRPVTGLLERLPPGQAAELAGALALGPPAAGNRFAVYLATLEMFSLASDAGPVLVLVDDLHWLDPPSAEAVVFAARRLQAEGVVVVMAARESGLVEGPGAPGLPVGIDVQRIGALPPAAAADLVRRSAGGQVSERVAAELVDLAEGNPLALVETTRTLSPDQLAGLRPLQPLGAGDVPGAALGRRLSGLSADTMLALLVIACADEIASAPLLEAIGDLGLPTDVLEPAEQAGVVTVDPAELRLRHPLLRGVLTGAASGPDRRRAHAALADVAARRGETAREAWHRAAALTRPDESAVEALALAAGEARARGGPGAAARALERASQITDRPQRRLELLAAAATEALSAGAYGWSLELVQRAIALDPAAAQNAQLTILRASAEQACGAPQVAHALLLELGRQVIAVQPDHGAVLLANASLAAVQLGDMHKASAAAELTVGAGVTPGSPVDLLCAAARAIVDTFRAVPGADVGPVLRVLEDEVRVTLPRWGGAVPFALRVAMVRDHAGTTRRVLERMIADARAGSELGLLPIFVGQLAELHRADGRWFEARAEALEALQLARDTAQLSVATYALALLAWIDGARGDAPACLARLQEAEDLFATTEPGSVLLLLWSARAMLHLTLGEPEHALLPLGRLLREEERLGIAEPAMYGWLPDLVEAAVKAGRLEEASDALKRLETGAAPTRWTRAVAARCRGLLADPGEAEEHFLAALTELGDDRPFDRARTELLLGERLRRARRRAAALPWLDSAADTFARLGAKVWAERARSELSIAGAERRPAGPVPEQQLTPRELQIAMMVAEGASNREVAAGLFLSDKTVEAHLTRIYRSLGVGSRAALGARLHERRA